MTQLSDDCFAFGGPLMRLGELKQLLETRVRSIPETETVALADALGRIAAQDCRSKTAIPSFDNSAVDGYAVRHADLVQGLQTRLAVSAYLRAGHQLEAEIAPKTAVRIFTGASLPKSADTVFMQEDCQTDGSFVILPDGMKLGANRRLAGEDVAIGSTVIARGQKLKPQDLAIAAASGLSRIDAVRRVKVALFSTGDEVFDPGCALPNGGIYDANRPLLRALLMNLGADVTDLGILVDDPATLRESLVRAAAGHDLVLTSGGVSTGDADHVKRAVESVGRLDFWRLAIKPGRPVTMGVLPKATAGTFAAFAGLPGNPVAVFVTFVLVIRALILRLSGASPASPTPLPVIAAFKYRKKEGRREYVRVTLTREGNGKVTAQKYRKDGAGVLSSLTETDGLVELPEEVTVVADGDTVGFLPYEGLIY